VEGPGRSTAEAAQLSQVGDVHGLGVDRRAHCQSGINSLARLLASTAAKLRHRTLASRARRGAPPPLSPYELWRVVSVEAAEVGKQQLR